MLLLRGAPGNVWGTAASPVRARVRAWVHAHTRGCLALVRRTSFSNPCQGRYSNAPALAQRLHLHAWATRAASLGTPVVSSARRRRLGLLQVDRQEVIQAGGEEEIEIRACTVIAVERIREALAAKFRGADGALFVARWWWGEDLPRGEGRGTYWYLPSGLW